MKDLCLQDNHVCYSSFILEILFLFTNISLICLKILIVQLLLVTTFLVIITHPYITHIPTLYIATVYNTLYTYLLVYNDVEGPSSLAHWASPMTHEVSCHASPVGTWNAIYIGTSYILWYIDYFADKKGHENVWEKYVVDITKINWKRMSLVSLFNAVRVHNLLVWLIRDWCVAYVFDFLVCFVIIRLVLNAFFPYRF